MKLAALGCGVAQWQRKALMVSWSMEEDDGTTITVGNELGAVEEVWP